MSKRWWQAGYVEEAIREQRPVARRQIMRRLGPFRSFLQDVDDPPDQGIWVRVVGVESDGSDGQAYGLTVTIRDEDPLVEHSYDLAERTLELQMREKGVWPS